MRLGGRGRCAGMPTLPTPPSSKMGPLPGPRNWDCDLIGKGDLLEFPLWLSWLRTQLVSIRMQVRSLASHSGLRISIAVSCGIGHRRSSDPVSLWLSLMWAGSCSSNETPSLGTSTCRGCTYVFLYTHFSVTTCICMLFNASVNLV